MVLVLFVLSLSLPLFAQEGWNEWGVNNGGVPPTPVNPEGIEVESGTPVEASPFSGKATYTGYAVGQTPDDPSNPDSPKTPGYGTVTIHADFDENKLSGSFDDLAPINEDADNDGNVDYTMEELAALGAGMANVSKDTNGGLISLEINNENVDWTNVSADLSASYEDPDNSANNMEIRGEMTGLFTGANNEEIGGDWDAKGYGDQDDNGVIEITEAEKIGQVGGTYSANS